MATGDKGGIDLAALFVNPDTFFGKGPIADPDVQDWLEGVMVMRPDDVGRMTKCYFKAMEPVDIGNIAKILVENIPPEELGRFFKGRIHDRLERRKDST